MPASTLRAALSVVFRWKAWAVQRKVPWRTPGQAHVVIWLRSLRHVKKPKRHGQSAISGLDIFMGEGHLNGTSIMLLLRVLLLSISLSPWYGYMPRRGVAYCTARRSAPGLPSALM